MRPWLLSVSVLLSALLISLHAQSASPSTDDASVFPARGVIIELKPQIAVVEHEAISITWRR